MTQDADFAQLENDAIHVFAQADDFGGDVVITEEDRGVSEVHHKFRVVLRVGE